MRHASEEPRPRPAPDQPDGGARRAEGPAPRRGAAPLRLRAGRSEGADARPSCARRCAPRCPRSRSTRAPWARRRCAAPWPGTWRAASASPSTPRRQVVPATGAKETIFHLPLRLLRRSGPARLVVMPDPGYPTYEVGTRFAGLEPVKVPLTAGNRFLVEPEALGRGGARPDADLLGRATRTTRPAPWRRATTWSGSARRPGATASSWPPTSATPTSTSASRRSPCCRCSVENVLAIHSCSKRSGMTGYRSGFVAGDPDLVAILKRLPLAPRRGLARLRQRRRHRRLGRRRPRRRAARGLPAEARPLRRLLPRARARRCTARRPPCTSG